MTFQELIEKQKILFEEYREQQQNSPLKGNPYIVGLHARALGIGDALSVPLISAAPEMFEALKLFCTHGTAEDLQNALDSANRVYEKLRGQV